MRYRVRHTTQYDYDEPVSASHAELRQLPGDVDGQICVERSVHTDPGADHVRDHRDYFGNIATTVAIFEQHERLVVTSTSLVDTTERRVEFGDAGRRPWRAYRPAIGDDHYLDTVEFSLDSVLVARSDRLADYAAPFFGEDVTLAEAVGGLCTRIHQEFEFDPEATDVNTPIDEVMELRKGVCQDFAHLMVGVLRSVGLAACYVSGYIETDPPPGKPRLEGADRTHAWVGVHAGDAGWIGVDPTNDQLAGPRYVTAAHGRDYHDVPPLKGVIFTDATESLLTVSVDVAPQQV